MANPRDIAFVVDMSGSMNDDTETCWATDAINREIQAGRVPDHRQRTDGKDLHGLRVRFVSRRTGVYWGPLGESCRTSNAYAELTKDNGPLTQSNIPADIRIESSDSETARKKKAYTAIIRYQIARVMPHAKPAPTDTNYSYWEKYLDYLMQPQTINSRTGGLFLAGLAGREYRRKCLTPTRTPTGPRKEVTAAMTVEVAATMTVAASNDGNSGNGNSGNGNSGNGNSGNGNSGNGNNIRDWLDDWLNNWTELGPVSTRRLGRCSARATARLRARHRFAAVDRIDRSPPGSDRRVSHDDPTVAPSIRPARRIRSAADISGNASSQSRFRSDHRVQ